MENYMQFSEETTTIIEQNGDILKVITITGNKSIVTKLKINQDEKFKIKKYIERQKKLEQKEEIYKKNVKECDAPKLAIILSLSLSVVLLILLKTAINNGIEAMSSFYILEKLAIPIISVGIATDIFMKTIKDHNEKLLQETTIKLQYNYSKVSAIIKQLLLKQKISERKYEIPEQIKKTEDIHKYIIEKEKNNDLKVKLGSNNKVPQLNIPQDLTKNSRITTIEKLKQLKQFLLSNIEPKTKLPKTKQNELIKGKTNHLSLQMKREIRK